MLLLLAFLLDAAIGDPGWLPHPVVLMGRLISRLEKNLRSGQRSPQQLLRRGVLLVTVVLFVVLFLSWGLIRLFTYVHPVAGQFLAVVLLSTTLASRCLAEAAKAIYLPLAAGKIEEARQAVAMVVGRDTGHMEAGEAARAAVETVAENTVDGVTAPLFYALLGGAPLALLYKAVNTMDSMLGYKNERYLWFGRAAARLDDAANWLPARLTVPVMLVAAALLRLNVKSAFAAVRRDGRKHPSPNSGLAEALTAGALGIVLGGENRYGGTVSLRPQLWPEGRPATADDIRRATLLMRLTSALFLAAGLAVRILLKHFL